MPAFTLSEFILIQFSPFKNLFTCDLLFSSEHLKLISVWQDDTQVLGNDANEIQQFYKKYCASMRHISEQRNL